MSLYTSDGKVGYLHADADRLDRQLREGDGIHWTGDPRLELRMGTLVAPRTMYVQRLKRTVRKGDIVARRYEIWRHCEDGEERIVRTYRLEEFDRILSHGDFLMRRRV